MQPRTSLCQRDVYRDIQVGRLPRQQIETHLAACPRVRVILMMAVIVVTSEMVALTRPRDENPRIPRSRSPHRCRDDRTRDREQPVS